MGSAALIFLLRRLAPNWPGMLIAVTLASIAAWLFHLPVETIGSHFGQLPDGLPSPRLPTISYATVLEVLPAALSFTLLGAVESLLSAKVADGMTGRKHRYNMEVVAQGVANVASAIFGGISVTGTIARTATNIRAGACSPVSGMAHALFVLVFMLTAAPLASFIPLSALAGVLVVVCWNMAEKEEFLRLLQDWRSAAVLIATFGLTLIEDLTIGIIAGCVLAAAFAVYDRVMRSAHRQLHGDRGWQPAGSALHSPEQNREHDPSMWQRPFYHEGMSELQDRFDGRRVAEAIERHRKHYEFWDDEKALIETSPFFFIGTSFDDYVDCNIKSGDPGFVKIVGPNVIEYPEYDGNSMYRTLGNLSRNPNVGLLFVRFDGKSRRMRINGRAAILDDAEAKAGISVRSSWCGSSARSIRTVRATCPIWPEQSCRLMFRVKGRDRRRRRSGRAAIISGTFCRAAIRMRRS